MSPEISTNAAHFFAAGLKGRAHEKNYEDHVAKDGVYEMEVPEGGRLVRKEIPMRSAMNEVLRDSYVEDCQKVIQRWNKHLEGTGYTLTLPSRRFHRKQGVFANLPFDPEGRSISQEEFDRKKDEWLPTESDRAYVQSLMHRPVVTPGHFANWIAPPPRGINDKPIDFEYVRYNEA